ncbi:MAG: hypothetical protein ACJ72E_00585 [Marmoricola sp.]
MTVTGALFVTAIVSIFAGGSWAKYQRRPARDPRPLVQSVVDEGGRATVVRALDDGLSARVICCFVVATAVSGGIDLWSSSMDGALVLFVFAVYVTVAVWLIQTGRTGHGSVWLTTDGVRQRATGVEQWVRWDDVVRVLPSATAIVIESSSALNQRRSAPRAWVGRGRTTKTEAMSVELRNVHLALQIPLYDAIQVWAVDRGTREEIGTDAATRRLLNAGAAP